MADIAPDHDPIVIGDVTFYKSELIEGYVSETGRRISNEEAAEARYHQELARLQHEDPQLYQKMLHPHLAATERHKDNNTAQPHPAAPASSSSSGFGKLLGGAAALALVVGLPVLGYHLATNAWNSYQQKKHPDISVAINTDGTVFKALGATGPEAERNVMAECHQSGYPCRTITTETTSKALCIAVVKDRLTGRFITDTLTDPKNDRLRNARDQLVNEYEKTGKHAQYYLSDIVYACSTDDLQRAFTESQNYQTRLTVREEEIHERVRQMNTLAQGHYRPKYEQIDLLDGSSGNLRRKMIVDWYSCVHVLNGEGEYKYAAVEVSPSGTDKKIRGFIEKDQLQPAPDCAAGKPLQRPSVSKPETPAARPPVATGSTKAPPDGWAKGANRIVQSDGMLLAMPDGSVVNRVRNLDMLQKGECVTLGEFNAQHGTTELTVERKRGQITGWATNVTLGAKCTF